MVDNTGKEIINTNKLYIWYMQKSFRDSLDMPVKPGDVVLVRGRRRKSRVLVMEVFNYDGDDRYLPVLRVLERYTPKE